MEGFLNLIFGYFGGGFSLNHKPYPYSLYDGEDEPSILATWKVWWYLGDNNNDHLQKVQPARPENKWIPQTLVNFQWKNRGVWDFLRTNHPKTKFDCLILLKTLSLPHFYEGSEFCQRKDP